MISRTHAKIINRVITILLWVLAVYLMVAKSMWQLFGFILVLHAVEVLTHGCKRGIKAGYSGIYSVVMTLILGFTWWLYLEGGNED